MSFRFAIIGAGWYGCHIASSFKSLGFDVTVFEAKNDIMQCASGNNQFRLHQGFHYARHHRTRIQSRDGFMRFMERYPHLSDRVDTNLYAVPQRDSLIDYLTYRLIMTSSGVEFSEVKAEEYNLSNCAGALLTHERMLLTSRAREYFRRRLAGCLRTGTEVFEMQQNDNGVKVNGEFFDYAIDATWGGMGDLELPVFYEPTLLLYYEGAVGSFALTMVDGSLCSIYPTDQPNCFTLSSVPHTPLGRFGDMASARSCISKTNTQTLNSKRVLMEAQISRYYPQFSEKFKYIEPQLSVKTKIFGAEDDRSCYVAKKGKRFVVMSGKIDTIFYAADTILSMIESENEMEIERL